MTAAAKFLITVEDELGSTAIIDLREIAAIRQDVEGDVEVHLKGGKCITLQAPECDIVEDLERRWRASL